MNWNGTAEVLPLSATTAGRTLDVSATGEAGLDWNNIGAPTTTVNLSGTTVKTATDVETDTAQIGTAGAGLTALGDTRLVNLDAAITSRATVAGVLAGVIEGTYTLAQSVKLMLSLLVGKASGGGTGTLTFRDMADTKARVTMTVDSNGNRSAVTRDET